MKSASLLTASVLLGCASAEVHKLKLNKVPLEEQLVSVALSLHRFLSYIASLRLQYDSKLIPWSIVHA